MKRQRGGSLSWGFFSWGLLTWSSLSCGLVACSSDEALRGEGEDGNARNDDEYGDGDGDGDGDVVGDGDGDVAGDGDGDGDLLGAPSSGSGGASSEPESEMNAGGASAEEELGTNPFVIASHDPLSTFAVDVDTASYDLFQSRSRSESQVMPSSVRLEEFVNYFPYEYPAPEDEAEHPFSIHLSAAPNLATRETRLLRVGIQGKLVEEKPPANLVFLVDVSGSMSDELPTVRKTLRETVELLEPDDSVAIVTYAASPGTLLSATPISEKQTILDAIERLTSGGSTNGAGGIVAAYAEAESALKEDGINHILMCTDGDFNVGLSNIEEVEELVAEKRKSGITLTALGYGRGNFNDQMMERISNIGNGIYSYIGSDDAAEKYVRERMIQSMIHIAKDMKIQVEFNRDHVRAYRLLGYENRAIADEDFRDDFVDAGEIASGHRVTALYELVLVDQELPDASVEVPLDDGAAYEGQVEVADEELVLVKVRYKQPGASESDPAAEVSQSLAPSEVAQGFESTQSDFQYAAAVAAFAEIIKESPYASRDALTAIQVILEEQAERDAERSEFFHLFTRAHEIYDF